MLYFVTGIAAVKFIELWLHVILMIVCVFVLYYLTCSRSFKHGKFLSLICCSTGESLLIFIWIKWLFFGVVFIIRRIEIGFIVGIIILLLIWFDLLNDTYTDWHLGCIRRICIRREESELFLCFTRAMVVKVYFGLTFLLMMTWSLF